MPIPKVIFQTSKKEQMPEYLVHMIRSKCPGYKYEYYTDNDIRNFFIENPIPEFNNIINIFHSFASGPHKADLFRYYYLYCKGGVFLDSDAMIYKNIDDIMEKYDFFSVFSKHGADSVSIFQGIIGCVPENAIIHEALKCAYNVDNDILQNDYHHFCKELYNVLQRKNIIKEYNIKLYKEEVHYLFRMSKIFDTDTNELVFKHFWGKQQIPVKKFNFIKEFLNAWIKA